MSDSGSPNDPAPAFRRQIICPICGFVSCHPKDIEFGYCGHCHDFTDGQVEDVPFVDLLDRTLYDNLDLMEVFLDLDDDATVEDARRRRICGHCQRQMTGFGQLNDSYLCHPDIGLDCYRLVTVHHHEMPCRRSTCGILMQYGIREMAEQHVADAEMRRLGYNLPEH